MKKEIELFTKVFKNFENTKEQVDYKYHHSIRVMNIAEKLAKGLKMNDKDVYIAKLCGLLHDIGRFAQYYYNDNILDTKNSDHGEDGYNLLLTEINKYTNSDEIKNIVLLCTRYHNKFAIPEGLEERVLMFLKIIRDSDKIDILYANAKGLIDFAMEGNKVSKNGLSLLYNKKLINYLEFDAKIEPIIIQLSFIYDINFKWSYNYIKNEKYINCMFEKIKNCNLDLIEEIDYAKKFMNGFIIKKIEN